MATAAATRRATIPADKAVVPSTLSTEDLLALLGQTGAIAQPGGDFHRMTLRGGILETDDGEMFPPKKEGPSLLVRIVKPPVYYNAFFLSTEGDGSFDATKLGRGDMNGRFCRKYDDPNEQLADTNEANQLYDQIAEITNQRGQFKADLQVQIVPDDGQLTGEETVYTLSISTTSVFEWRGSSRNPSEGYNTDKNFIVKLAELAVKNAVEAGLDEGGQKKTILDAMTSLRLGGVVAEVYLPRTENEKKTQTWTLVSFVPIHIAPLDGDAPALESGTNADVPF